MRLLIVEDESKLLRSILEYLKDEDYIIDSTGNLQEAIDFISLHHYDCLVVDLMLGDSVGTGFDLINTLKLYKADTGIIIISAKDSLEDRVKGLEFGSDDYITKPFHLAELKARIRSVLRRRMHHGLDQVEYGSLRLVIEKKEVFMHEVKQQFSPMQFDLLLFFVSNKEKIITKTSIADHLWSDDFSFGSYDFLYTHIKNLRKKLMAGGCDYLENVYGVGYKFEKK
ncbi:response regulator transcription factor [Marinoscillum sp.]|uniref:response regulator transcription factor n=1 Tax=Marinoscillum sp. TaxID=2024838 RepID=UPI003BAA1361